MGSIPARVADRLAAGLKRFQPILTDARARDVNEGDTVVITADMLAEMFGYDKYAEITREHAIRGTYCDLAVKLEGKLQFLIEVKAIGLDLKDMHIKQAVDYAANQGMEWVALTNGVEWRVFRISFGKPIEHELVLEINLLALSPKNGEHIESLFLLTRESLCKSALDAYHDRREATSRFFLASLITTPPVLDVIRRELRRLSPDTKVTNEEIQATIEHEVLKREVVEGPKAEQAQRKVRRAAGKTLKASRIREPEAAPAAAVTAPPKPPVATGDMVAPAVAEPVEPEAKK